MYLAASLVFRGTTKEDMAFVYLHPRDQTPSIPLHPSQTPGPTFRPLVPGELNRAVPPRHVSQLTYDRHAPTISDCMHGGGVDQSKTTKEHHPSSPLVAKGNLSKRLSKFL